MLRSSDVLVCEISGRRPGGKAARPTERLELGKWRHLVVSNDAEGYETDWEIVEVPDEYKESYAKDCRISDNMWLAQMNRTYALDFARENGFRYVVQLDDNIVGLGINYEFDLGSGKSLRYTTSGSGMRGRIAQSFVEMLITVLQCTDAGLAGCNLISLPPSHELLRERFVYSFLAFDLERCTVPFQGDFEDDIEYRLKLAQMGIPTVQVCPLRYGKTSALGGGDRTGCRQAYADAGLGRGDHMRRLYGEIYSCGTGARNATTAGAPLAAPVFRHRLKSIKVGVRIYDDEKIEKTMVEILERHARKDIKDRAVKMP